MLKEILLWGLIFIPSLVQAEVPGGLPQHIYLKDRNQSFSYENYYVLKGGKIWVKPNELTTGVREEWALFDGTGLPFGKKARSFGKDDRIVEIAQEGLMVVALSNKGRFYFWIPTYKPHTVWQDKAGTPFAADLMLPKSKLWTFSMGVTRAPHKRLTPMHDIVSYYEDTNGKKVEFGFTATVFTVDPNGQILRLWDTGLPPSFHRGFVSPERGRFVIEGLSAAGSALFVIDKSGKMYTRMYDYEINGACPGIRFTYDKDITKDDDKNKVYDIFEGLRTLPLEDWREQTMELKAGEAITSRVTIVLTGKGNAARELRVEGRNSSGESGYFSKGIMDSVKAWTFVKTEELIKEEAFLTGQGTRSIGNKLDKTFSGELEGKIKIELVDFHHFNSISKLRVSGGNKQFEMVFHSVDAWGLTVQRKHDPEMVGTVQGEPKLLKGTLEIPNAVLKSKDPWIRRVLDTYFKRFHLVPFVFDVSANDREVVIQSRRAMRRSDKYMDLKFPKRLKLRLKNLDPAPVVSAKEEPLFPPGKIVTLKMVDEAIKSAEGDLKSLKKINRHLKGSYLKQAAWNGVAFGLWNVANGLASLLNITSLHTLVGGLSITGGGVLKRHAGMNFRMLFTGSAEYKIAKTSLKKRIKRLKELKKRSLTAAL